MLIFKFINYKQMSPKLKIKKTWQSLRATLIYKDSNL